MKFFKILFIAIIGVFLVAEEDPMENMTIEYGMHDILQKESASSQGKYYPIEYYENVIQYVQEGNELSRQNKPKEAIERFKLALETDPHYVFALNGLGNANIKIRQYDLAEENFLKAIEFGPDYAFSYNNLANLYIMQGKLSEAKTLLLQALKKDPNSARINYNIGNLYLREGKNHIAASYYLKSIKFDPEFCNARYNLAISYWRTGNEKQAISEYEKLVDRCPGHSKGVLNLAAFYYENGEKEKAITLYKQALIINPDVRLYLALGHVYHNIGYNKHEIDAYLSAVEEDSTNLDALFYLATAYQEQGMPISARQICDKALELSPDDERFENILFKMEQK